MVQMRNKSFTNVGVRANSKTVNCKQLTVGELYKIIKLGKDGLAYVAGNDGRIRGYTLDKFNHNNDGRCFKKGDKVVRLSPCASICKGEMLTVNSFYLGKNGKNHRITFEEKRQSQNDNHYQQYSPHLFDLYEEG